jgi:hypothetical protein
MKRLSSCVVAGLVALAGATGASARTIELIGVTHSGYQVSRLDPVSLQMAGPPLQLDESGFPPIGYERSPDGEHFAFASGETAEVQVFDSLSNGAQAKIPTPAGNGPLAWLTPSRLLTMNTRSTTVTILDPLAGTVVKTVRIGGRPIASTVVGDQLALVRDPGSKRAVVTFLSAAGRKTVVPLKELVIGKRFGHLDADVLAVGSKLVVQPSNRNDVALVDAKTKKVRIGTVAKQPRHHLIDLHSSTTFGEQFGTYTNLGERKVRALRLKNLKPAKVQPPVGYVAPLPVGFFQRTYLPGPQPVFTGVDPAGEQIWQNSAIPQLGPESRVEVVDGTIYAVLAGADNTYVVGAYSGATGEEMARSTAKGDILVQPDRGAANPDLPRGGR